MSVFKKFPNLHAFLATHFSDSDPETDIQTARAWSDGATADDREPIVRQALALLKSPELPVDEFGAEANRWFGSDEEAREWLQKIVDIIDEDSSGAELVVKDSNGALLAEGDTVQVIKDLKVKGGSSDLKRGTMIKNIHLVDDAEVIECRVNGSTLVLKTCFLKKA